MKRIIVTLSLALPFFAACKSEESKPFEKAISREIIIVGGKTSFYRDPFDNASRFGVIPDGSKLMARKEKFVFSGVAGFPWYYAVDNAEAGWISSMVTKDAPDIVIDKSNAGKCKIRPQE